MSEFTVGVEEEYQLISASTGELRSRAGDVLEIDWSGELHPESQQTMLEIGTPVCAGTAELEVELRRLRLQVATAAEAEGLRSVAAGIHPFSRWEGQTATPGERYERIVERFGRVVRTEQIFGMHTHVAVDEAVDRVRVMNVVRDYIPHLLALSASSPLYEGEDTSYASYRTVLAQRLPHSGPPPRFDTWDSFSDWRDLLVRTGALQDATSLYWGIRPHAVYPTLEFRGTDVCPRLEDAVAIAGLCRCLVAGAVDGRLDSPARPWSDSAADEVLSANEWQAARFGLGGTLVDPRSEAGSEPIRDSVRRLLERLGPVADALGESGVQAGIERILTRGNAADRIRERLPADDDLRELVGWLSRETLVGVGMDRRAEQREADA